LDGAAALPCRVCYVMTDLSSANIDFWRRHEKLQRFVALAQLDFARFDARSDRALRLEMSVAVLVPAAGPHHLPVLGEDFVDGIEHGLFKVKDGGLDAYWVSLRREEPAQSAIALDWQTHPCARNHYDDPWYDALLRDYAGRLDDGATFLFPIAAMRCFDA